MAKTTKTNVMVRLRCTYDNGRAVFRPGEVIGVSETEAAAMLRSGLAENVAAPAPAKAASAKSAAKTEGEQPPATREQSEGDSGDSGEGEGDEETSSEGGEGEADQ